MKSKLSSVALARNIAIAIYTCTFFSAHSQRASAQEKDDFPYELSVAKEIILTTASAGLGAAGTALFFQREAPSQNSIESLDKNNINRFDRYATHNSSKPAFYTSQVAAPLISIVSPIVTFWGQAGKKKWKNAFTIAVMYAEALSLTLGLTWTVKTSVRRLRPVLYNPDVSTEDKLSLKKGGAQSFFSGHTSAAFCSVVFLGKTFSDIYPESNWRYFIWTAGLLGAFGAGYLRVVAGMHYLTDIVAGALVGATFGLTVPLLHKKRSRDIMITPIAGKQLGALLVVSF